ncbi:carboxylate-amine ligase [Jannaschia marina]|uniref:carboxylate-amine ligase n=1 Tax=Jannaschia marina TaxID=2741674 RepID=UPI0015CC5B81|nr:carboxylate-amine ligase [Jannaschia marina]
MTAQDEPDFTIGIEEEYLLTDATTGALARVPEALMRACRDALGDQVSPEFLDCQIEVGTGVCDDITAARSDLAHLRRTIADLAGEHGLRPIAASCHPFSDWRDQATTDKARYRDLARDLRDVAHRMLICGMHVHVGLPDRETRIDLMNRAAPYLPILLALSTSSPFWSGQDTGLASYRLGVFDNMPRTGLPPRLESWEEWERRVALLVDLEVIEDATKIWWDLRPSHSFPTLETRICDVCPRLEDTLTLAALTQALMRALWRDRGTALPDADLFLLAENRWRAQRHGGTAGLIDLAQKRIVPLAEAVDTLCTRLAPDAAALGSAPEIARARDLAADGTSADRQRRVHAAARTAGADETEALRAVALHLAEAFTEGL